MNIRDLQYVSAVARLRHFGRAAEACHVSQPALSSQIKKLEEELGVTIFERDNRSVRLTAVGTQVVELAEQALRVIDNIRVTAETAIDPLSGHCKVGMIPTIAPYLIPHFVNQCEQHLPQLRVQFQEDITDRLNTALLTGDIDIAILATPPESSKLEAIPLYDEPFWVIYPAPHALRLLEIIKTSDLPVDELLLLSEGHCFRDQALDVCQIDSVAESRSIRATSLETLINMVAAGQGVTLVPATALSAGWVADRGVKTQKLGDNLANRRIYLTFRKSFPRQVLLERMAEVVCRDLPKTVSLVVSD